MTPSGHQAGGWRLESGIRSLESGVWNPESGIRSLESGAWNPEPGIRRGREADAADGADLLREDLPIGNGAGSIRL